MDDSCQVPQIDMTLPYPSDPVNFLDCALIPLFIPTSQFLMVDEILHFKSSIPLNVCIINRATPIMNN